MAVSKEPIFVQKMKKEKYLHIRSDKFVLLFHHDYDFEILKQFLKFLNSITDFQLTKFNIKKLIKCGKFYYFKRHKYDNIFLNKIIN